MKSRTHRWPLGLVICIFILPPFSYLPFLLLFLSPFLSLSLPFSLSLSLSLSFFKKSQAVKFSSGFSDFYLYLRVIESLGQKNWAVDGGLPLTAGPLSQDHSALQKPIKFWDLSKQTVIGGLPLMPGPREPGLYCINDSQANIIWDNEFSMNLCSLLRKQIRKNEAQIAQIFWTPSFSFRNRVFIKKKRIMTTIYMYYLWHCTTFEPKKMCLFRYLGLMWRNNRRHRDRRSNHCGNLPTEKGAEKIYHGTGQMVWKSIRWVLHY